MPITAPTKTTTVIGSSLNTSVTAAYSGTITAGRTLIVLAATQYQITSITSNRGDTFVRAYIFSHPSGSGHVQAWYARSAIGGSTTLTINMAPASRHTIVALEFSSDLIPAFAGSNTATSRDVFPTPAPGWGYGGEYATALNLCAFDAGNLTTLIGPLPLGWTNLLSSSGDASSQTSGFVYRIITAAGNYYPFWMLNIARQWLATQMWFVEAPPPVPPGPQPGFGPHAGPPMMGSPLYGPAHVSERPPQPATPQARSRQGQPLVPTLPDAKDETRLERAIRELSDIVNSLARSQQLFLNSLGEYGIRGGGFDETRPPTTSDDTTTGARASSIWVDNTNTDLPVVYVCTDPAEGAAVWRKVRLHAQDQAPASGVFP